jgi:hypothetical protein
VNRFRRLPPSGQWRGNKVIRALCVAFFIIAFATVAKPRFASACSAPPVQGPDRTYEALAVRVSGQSPSLWIFRDDAGTEHQLAVMQPPGGDEAACYITATPPIVGNRYEVTERHLRTGEIAMVTSSGGSSYRLLIDASPSATTGPSAAVSRRSGRSIAVAGLGIAALVIATVFFGLRRFNGRDRVS